jgi:hypothetical protein
MDIQAINGVFAFIWQIFEEVVANDLPFVLSIFFLPVRKNHVVHSLKGASCDSRILLHNFQVVFETALPIEFAKVLGVLKLIYEC